MVAGSAELEFGGAFLDESNGDSEDETGDPNQPFLAGAGAFVLRRAKRHFFGEDRRVQLEIASTQSESAIDGDDDMHAFGWGVGIGASRGVVYFTGNAS